MSENQWLMLLVLMIMWYNSLKLQKSDPLIQSHCKTLLIGFVEMWSWTQNILQFGWRMDRRLLKRNCNESLAVNFLEILCSSRSSRSSCVLRVLRVFFIFEGLWWKFFEALEAWIRRVSPIYGLLMFFSDLQAWFP